MVLLDLVDDEVESAEVLAFLGRETPTFGMYKRRLPSFFFLKMYCMRISSIGSVGREFS